MDKKIKAKKAKKSTHPMLDEIEEILVKHKVKDWLLITSKPKDAVDYDGLMMANGDGNKLSELIATQMVNVPQLRVAIKRAQLMYLVHKHCN